MDSDKLHKISNPSLSSSEHKKKTNSGTSYSSKPTSEENNVRKSLFKNGHEEFLVNNKSTLKETDNLLQNRDLSRTPIDISDTNCLLSPSESHTDENGHKKSKKHKKKTKSSKTEVLMNKTNGIIEDYSPQYNSDSKKKKKHKHKKLKKKSRKDSSSSDSDSSYSRRHKYTKHKKRRYDSDSSSSDYNEHQHKEKRDHSDDYEWVEKTIDSPIVKESLTVKKGKIFINFHFNQLDNIQFISLNIYDLKCSR